jgi:hypothetical protein
MAQAARVASVAAIGEDPAPASACYRIVDLTEQDVSLTAARVEGSTSATKPCASGAESSGRPTPSSSVGDGLGQPTRWCVDEMQLKIRGKKYWLWRAVDQDGVVVDILVQ